MLPTILRLKINRSLQMLTNNIKIRSCNQIFACIQSGRRSFSQAKVKEAQNKSQKEEKYAPISPVWSAFNEHGHPVQRTIRDWDSLLRSTPRSKISHKEVNGLRLPKIVKIDMSFRFKTPAKQPNRQVMDGFHFLRLLSDQKPLISLGKEGHGNTVISVKVTVRDEVRVNGIVTQLKKYADLFQASDEVPKAGLTINPIESNDEHRNLAAELSFAIRNYTMFLNESVHPGITIPGNYANVGATLRFTIRVENLEKDFDVVPFLFQCGIGKFVSKGETGFQKVILSKRPDLVPEKYMKELQEELRLLDLKRRGFLVGGVDKRAEARKEQEKRETEAKNRKESESKDKKAPAASPKPAK